MNHAEHMIVPIASNEWVAAAKAESFPGFRS
jgi:hypothetical protein